MRPERLPGFIEATYALELDDERWIQGVAAATREVWGRPGSTLSGFYDASDLHNFRPLRVVTEGVSEELAAAFFGSLRYASPALVGRLYRRSLAGTLRVVAPELSPSLEETKLHGVVDSMGFFGSEPDGFGCSVTISMSAVHLPGRDELDIYRRMACHLAAAFRCRRRLHAQGAPGAQVDLSAGAEAVLDPSGKVLHAEGPAKEPAAQERLKEAVKRRAEDRVRDPVAALVQRAPLEDARWTLVSTSEARYVVARENQVQARGLPTLSERERQVVALLALGHTTKEIAYALGIAASTTRVLLARAGTRLGGRTRDELIRIVTREALPGFEAVEEALQARADRPGANRPPLPRA